MFFNYSNNYTNLWVLAFVVSVFAVGPRVALGQVADENWPMTNGSGRDTSDQMHDVGVTFNQDVTIVEADQMTGVRGQYLDASGNVSVKQGDQTIQSDYLYYDISNEEVTASGRVKITKPGVRVNGDTLRYRTRLETGEIDRAEYFLGERAHGVADKLIFLGPDRKRAQNATYTSCDVDKEDVYLKTSRLDIYEDKEVASARNVAVWFKGAPVLYSPYLSVPLSDKRKTGFLTPSYGQSVQNGFEVSVPLYLNLAPNFDGTATMRTMSSRGNLLKTDWRYLGKTFNGNFKFDRIESDKVFQEQFGLDSSRSSYIFDHYQRLGSHAAGYVNFRGISDDSYLKDLSNNSGETALLHLPRAVGINSAGNDWYINSRVVHYQTLNFENPPFQLDPQIDIGISPPLGLGFESESKIQVSDFDHQSAQGIKDGGTRTIIYPGVRYTYENDFLSLSPKVGFHYTNYELDRGRPEGRTEDRSLPIYSVRGSIAFEREGMLAGTGYTQTLEPTFSYVHVPFERQNHLPIFDSGLADFSMSQIFSENIFSGGDRINDADQLTIGVSSKFLDLNSGAERFKFTVAQRFHLDEELVVINSTDAPRTANRSDILLEAGGKITDRVNASSLMQYSAILDEVVRQEQRLQYAPESGKVLNMLYRYSRDNHEQYDISGQWPIKGRWGVAGRWNYSRDSSKLLEGVGGLEYKVGCWAFRFVANRFLSGQDALGKDLYTTGFFVQLELRGVTNIGSNAIGELRRSIPGYSSN